MFAISVRDRPCSALLSRSSSGRATVIAPSSPRSTVIGSATVCVRVPLGPLTVTVRPSMSTSTPEGTATGSRPIRLIGLLLSPDVGEDFPAHATLGGLLVGQQAGRRRDDRGAEAAEHARQAGRLRVHAQAGLRHPPHAGDAALAVRAVLQLEHEYATDLPLGGVGHAEAGDVTLLLEDLRDVALQLRVRH